MSEKSVAGYLLVDKTSVQFLERRLATLFGINSMSIRALDLVCKEMCTEKGFKRDDGTDYYIHCINVANSCISFCVKDEDAICAALLHDIVEDVPGYTHELISQLFNPNVACIVMLLTKKEGVDYKQEDNIKEYLKNIFQNVYASAIKTADRMHNMMTLQEKSFEARYNKAIETKKYYLEFFHLCRKNFPRYENLFYAAETQIQTLIFEIESFYGEILRLENKVETSESEIEKLKKEIEKLKNI